MNKEEICILYVDDEVNNLIAFKANFRLDYKILTAETSEEGMKILRENKIQIIITDQRMPGQTGVEFLERAIKEFPDPIRILLTGYSDINVVIDAINKGQIFRYLMKPFNDMELKMILENAAEVYNLREENKELLKKLVIANEQLEFMLRQKLIS
ncbi:MAG TPA: response regulator [Bacteroidia bacterium]|jgi:response regulator RpfG family c-di-GMP phosphodiesterase|nr:response regulator [Bacteroidia bacterium]